MALLPRDVIKPALITDQVQVITLSAHRPEALRPAEVAALAPGGCKYATAAAMVSLHVRPALNRVPNRHDVG